MAKRKELVLVVGMALAVGTAAGEELADFTPQFELSGLNGSNGVVFNGAASGDFTGQSVSEAGDINGDGFDDLVIGAPYANNGAEFAGKSYVVFGNDQGWTSPLNLSTLDVNSGLVISGDNVFDSLGSSISEAGDINGDGIDDLVNGALNSSLGDKYAGATFVVFGNDQALPASLSVSSLDGSNGFAILGMGAYSSTGTSVSGVGDFNGDSINDLIIGAPFTNTGNAYVVFGSDQAWDPAMSVSELNGNNGFRIDGINPADTLGISVSGAGDINGDGIDDLIIGATLAENPDGIAVGEAYVVFGKQGVPTHPLNPLALNGSNGFAIVGVGQGDATGFSVSSAGDINGDTIDDLIIGAPKADPHGDSSGVSYVVFGKQENWNSPLNLVGLNGSNGFSIKGVNAGDESGTSVSAAGDVNGDSIDDLIIGARKADPNGDATGASYVIFGSNQPWSSTLALSNLNGANGFRVDGVSTGDQSGTSVSAAGDINADGSTDFLVGAPLADPNGDQSGAAYVVYDAVAVNSDIIFADSFEQ